MNLSAAANLPPPSGLSRSRKPANVMRLPCIRGGARGAYALSKRGFGWAIWHSGTLTLWCSDTMALRCSDTMALRCSGARYCTWRVFKVPQPPFPLIPLYTDAVRRSLRYASGGSVYTSADWVGAPRVGAR